MGITYDPGNVTKGDLARSDYGSAGEEELTPAALQEIIEEQIIGDGSIGIITSINGYSNGYYENPDFVVLYDYADSTIDNLGDNDVAIVIESYPYISLYDTSNEFIDLFGTMSDFSEPAIEKEEPSSFPYEYSASYSANEISGFKERFGFTNTFSDSIYDTAVKSMAQEVIQSYSIRRYIFKQIRPERLSQNNFSSMARTQALMSFYTSSADTPRLGY